MTWFAFVCGLGCSIVAGYAGAALCAILRATQSRAMVRPLPWAAVLLASAIAFAAGPWCVAPALSGRLAPNVRVADAAVPLATRLSATVVTGTVAAGETAAGTLPERTPIALRLVFTIWLAVAIFRLAYIGLALVRIRRLKRDGSPPPMPFSWEMPRGARVVVAAHHELPFMVGYRKPAIVVPADFFATFAEEEVRCVLLHECSHLARRDDWWTLVQSVAQALLWFNPAVHLAARRMAAEREIACDHDVVTQTHNVSQYARFLVRFSERAHLAPGLCSSVLGGSQLLERIERLAGRPGRRLKTAAMTLCTALVWCAAIAAAVPALVRSTDARTGAAVVALHRGEVLAFGGVLRDGTLLDTVDIEDTATGRRRFLRPLPAARAGATATALRDGTVLVAGGWDAQGPIRDALVYHPKDGRIETVGSMTYPRAGHSATLLAQGRVFMYGGEAANGRFITTPEIYDPATHKFTRTAMDGDGRAGHRARLLADGNVVIWGGFAGRGPIAHCVIGFDAVHNRVFDIPAKRVLHFWRAPDVAYSAIALDA